MSFPFAMSALLYSLGFATSAAMEEQALETDILLAMLSSMVQGPTPTHEALLVALADAGGDVECAARRLNGRDTSEYPSPSKSNLKRKRKIGLDGWFTSKRRAGSSKDQVQHPVLGLDARETALGLKKTEPISLSSDEEDEQHPAALLGDGPNTEQMERKQRTPVPLMSVLRQAPSIVKGPPKLLPRTLGTATLVSQFTPCTFHPSILPPDLASRLFYVMLREAAGWSRNKWWLFDRLVESPHRTSFYARDLPTQMDDDMQEAARYWYNGRPSPPPNKFLSEMEEACEIVERTVNEEIRKRGKLFPFEWPTSERHPWRANVAAANCYVGSKETVGYHSDQLTYLGPCPTIASISLGTTRTFRLREVVPHSERAERNAQTFNIPVTHNSLLIMHASCQERFKHTVPPQLAIDAFHPPLPPPELPPMHLNARSEGEGEDTGPEMMPPTTSRINITFRFYRPDFSAKTIPRCQCGIPAVLRPDMKNREDSSQSEWDKTASMRYFWMCYGGAQNDGKGCSFFQILDMEKEGRRDSASLDLRGKETGGPSHQSFAT